MGKKQSGECPMNEEQNLAVPELKKYVAELSERVQKSETRERLFFQEREAYKNELAKTQEILERYRGAWAEVLKREQKAQESLEQIANGTDAEARAFARQNELSEEIDRLDSEFRSEIQKMETRFREECRSMLDELIQEREARLAAERAQASLRSECVAMQEILISEKSRLGNFAERLSRFAESFEDEEIRTFCTELARTLAANSEVRVVDTGPIEPYHSDGARVAPVAPVGSA